MHHPKSIEWVARLSRLICWCILPSFLWNRSPEISNSSKSTLLDFYRGSLCHMNSTFLITKKHHNTKNIASILSHLLIQLYLLSRVREETEEEAAAALNVDVNPIDQWWGITPLVAGWCKRIAGSCIHSKVDGWSVVWASHCWGCLWCLFLTFYLLCFRQIKNTD